jgi:PAS domain S-box-containing protein
MTPRSPGKPPAGHTRLVVGIVLVAGGLTTLLVSIESRREIHDEARQRFERLAERVRNETLRRVRSIEFGLIGTRGFFAGSQSVEHAEFRAYADSRNVTYEFPGAQGIGYIHRVRRESLDGFVRATRADGCPDFSIKTSGDAADLFVIKYIEPREANESTRGFDIGQDPARREAAERAMQTGRCVLTKPIALVEGEQAGSGLLYLLAVYQNGSSPTTPRQREEACVGWVYMPLTVHGALSGIADVGEGLLDFEVYDGTQPDALNLMFDADGHLGLVSGRITLAKYAGRMFVQERITVGDRPWTLRMSATPAFKAAVNTAPAFASAVVCAMLTMLLAGLVWALGSSRARAARLAAEMTADLEQAKTVAEEAYREALALRAGLDRHSILSVTDARGLITEVSDGFCEATGYTRAELIGRDHGVVSSDHHPESCGSDMGRTIASGETRCDEICYRRKDGTRYWAITTVTPLFSQDGRVEKYVSLGFDITDRKKLEDELQRRERALQDKNALLEAQGARLLLINAGMAESRKLAEAANRSKSAFLANMSHDIRTPLTAILGYAEVIEANVRNPDNREAVSIIRRNGALLLDIINDILDLSKIEAGKMTVERVPCSPIGIVADIEALMRVRAESKALTLSVEHEMPLPAVVETDPTRLKQILVNLVGNAIKFTEVGGVRIVVRFDAAADPPEVQFEVVDSGIGIPREHIQNLFQPFTQADSSTTRRFGGTGLGLAICARFAELLGGRVTVESEEGVGSRFRMHLPIGDVSGAGMIDEATIPGSDAPEVPPAPTMPTVDGTRVLLAEDGPDNQRLISMILRKAGAEVEIVGNGQEAVDAASEALRAGRPFDVILMDMQMPVMDGYSATRILRERDYALPIVAITAHAMSGDSAKCRDAGCDDYATKPIQRTHLISMIRKWADRQPAVSAACESEHPAQAR